MVEVLYAGFECAAKSDWKAYTPAPKAPSNYKDPDKISRYVAEATAKAETEAKFKPLAGYVEKAVMLLASGEKLQGGSGAEVYSWLSQYIKDRRDNYGVTTFQIFGIHLRSRFHHCAVDAAVAGTFEGSWGFFAKEFNSPLALRETIQLLDPVRMIFGGEYEDSAVFSLLPLIDDKTDYRGVDGEAVLVRTLVERFGLADPPL